MKVLAIETSMGRTSVALTAEESQSPPYVRTLAAGERQAERLMPLIADLMSAAAVPFSALEKVAVCIGPGGFSGIRTGVAAARGIGLAAQVPVVGATSFRIMATAFEDLEDVPNTYGLVAQAGLHSVFCQVIQKGLVPITDIVALRPFECAAFFARAEVLTGPAAATLLEDQAVSLQVRTPDLWPDAVTLANIAMKLDPERDPPSPYYVRPPDARPQNSIFPSGKDTEN